MVSFVVDSRKSGFVRVYMCMYLWMLDSNSDEYIVIYIYNMCNNWIDSW